MIRWRNHEPARLKTCRQISIEASEIYYGNNSFMSTNVEEFHAWLIAIGPERRTLLKSVELHFRFRKSDRSLSSTLLEMERREMDLVWAGIPLRNDVSRLVAQNGDRSGLWNKTEIKRQMEDEDRTLYGRHVRWLNTFSG